MSDEVSIALNRLAREQMKHRILADIAVDLAVCEIEGLDRQEYVRELRTLLSDIGSRLDRLNGGRPCL
jgi:hypothetical protein